MQLVNSVIKNRSDKEKKLNKCLKELRNGVRTNASRNLFLQIRFGLHLPSLPSMGSFGEDVEK